MNEEKKEKKVRRMATAIDGETYALVKVKRILDELDFDAAKRTISYLNERYARQSVAARGFDQGSSLTHHGLNQE